MTTENANWSLEQLVFTALLDSVSIAYQEIG